jgi:hypothetical protein
MPACYVELGNFRGESGDVAYSSIRPVLWAIAVVTAVMLVLTPAPVKAQTTFAVAKVLCPWTNAPQPPVPGPCLTPANQINQVVPGQPVFYLVTIVGNANPWTLTLNEIYPPGFAGNVQDIRCVDAGNSAIVATSLAPVSIMANQTLHCTIGGYFTASTATATDASNTVNLTATGPGGATGTGTAKVTATVLTTATLPTDLSITKTASVNAIPLGATVTYTMTISNAASGVPVYLGGFLRVADQLAILPGSMQLKATLVGPPPICTASTGAQCVDPAPFANASPLTINQPSSNPTSWWNVLARWRHAAGNSGFLPPGGSMTLVYTLQIDGATTCSSNATGHGFKNFASFDLLGQPGATVAELNSANNGSDTSDAVARVDITTSVPTCPGGDNPNVTVTKTARNPLNLTSWPWGSSVTYDITIVNNSGVALTNLTMNDSAYSNYSDTTIGAEATTNPCVPNCSSSIVTGPQLLGYSGPTLWYSNAVTSLADQSSITFPITIKYDMNSCQAQPHNDWSITNRIWVNFTTPSGNHNRWYTEKIDMAPPPLCDFKVTKTFQGGAPPATLHFNTPYQYDVTFTNQSAQATTIYTLADMLRVDAAGYAVSMPMTYSYSCTGPAGLTGYQAQSAGFPALASGNVQYTSTPVNGSPIMYMVGAPITFPAGATLTCTVNVVVQRPAPGDPNCMGTGAAGLQNTAMLFPSSGYYFGWGVPAVAALWADARAPLPRCYNLTVNKAVNPPAALGTGPPLAYTISVTNNGDPIAMLQSPDWLTLTDLFTGTYSPGAANTNPVNACGPLASDTCQFITNSGNPISLGIKNLASGQAFDLTFPLAPPFTTENVRNDVAIQAQGTLATDWYAREPNTLVNFKEVPITNPASNATAMLKVCKVAGVGVKIGTRFDFTATAAGSGRPVTVPAGPAPGGYCQIVGTYASGTPVVLAETVPPRHEVVAIEVLGAAAAHSPVVDIQSGSVGLTLDEGVSEATFTNVGHGYAEICKSGDVTGLFRFTLDGVPLEVPAGACTPAIELRAGMHRLVELDAAGTAMLSCAIWPKGRSLDCPAGGRTVSFEVRAGDLSTQSVVTVVNGPAGPGYGQRRGKAGLR